MYHVVYENRVFLLCVAKNVHILAFFRLIFIVLCMFKKRNAYALNKMLTKSEGVTFRYIRSCLLIMVLFSKMIISL